MHIYIYIYGQVKITKSQYNFVNACGSGAHGQRDGH